MSKTGVMSSVLWCWRAADVVSEGFFLGLELFDLATDPEERTSLAEKQEEVIYWLWMFLDPSTFTTGWKMIKIQKGEVGRMLALLEEETTRALALTKVDNNVDFTKPK